MTTCPNCKAQYTPELQQEHNAEAHKKWQGGVTAQDAFPYATAAQREQLISGICSNKCWDEFLNVTEEEDYCNEHT